MTQRKNLPVLLAVGLILSAGTAPAETTVLGLRSVDGDEMVAERITRFLRDFIVSPGIDSVSDQAQSLEQMLLPADCGDDTSAPCTRQVAEMLGAMTLVRRFVTRMPEDGGRFSYSTDLRRFESSRRAAAALANGTPAPTHQGTADPQILADTPIDVLWDRTPPARPGRTTAPSLPTTTPRNRSRPA
jgi:hypothetical protein